MAFPLFDLGGRRALVTGSSQGIGFALAQGLAAHGAEVVLNGRDGGKLAEAAGRIPGATIGGGVGEAPLVDAEDAGDPYCRVDGLDPDVVEGAIVLCLRGQNGRVEKSRAVAEAGGVHGGRVIGATDRGGAHPTTAAYSPYDVAATLYAALGIDPATELHDRQGRAVPMLPEGRPIPGVL